MAPRGQLKKNEIFKTFILACSRLTLDVFSKGFNEKEYLHWLSGYNFLWYDISEKPCWKLWDWNSTGTKKWQFYQRLYFYFVSQAKQQKSAATSVSWSSVSKCGALAPEWRFGTSLWRQKFSQALRKKVFFLYFKPILKNCRGKS